VIEVVTNLFVGSGLDYEAIQNKPGWFVIHAAQIPWFNNLNINGLWYENAGSLTLNLLDARDPKYIPKEVIDKAISVINNNRRDSRKILIHCNLGLSRSPSISMLYLLKHTSVLRKDCLENTVIDFRKLYPQYSPGVGLQYFIDFYYKEYAQYHA
jgi:hypothetical protein